MTTEHWERAYAARPDHSWDQTAPGADLTLLASAGMTHADSVIDVGGGNGVFAQALLERGHPDVTVLDLAESALEAGRRRLGDAADSVHWLAADLTSTWLPARRYGVWHDRAVFHFMTADETRDSYRHKLRAGTRPGSLVCVGTFAPTGPTSCSGLPVTRYAAAELARVLNAPGLHLSLLASDDELHHTPSGATQPFTWVTLRRHG